MASPSRYKSFISLETGLYFVGDDVIEGSIIVESCEALQWVAGASDV
jgi:hypothetical protein